MDQIKSGKFIAEERKKKSYTQRQLADILQISDKTISKQECGYSVPDAEMLKKIAEILETDVSQLLGNPIEKDIQMFMWKKPMRTLQKNKFQ